MAITQIIQPKLKRVHAGAQIQAAGILFVAQDTKSVLAIFRSALVVDPLRWCGIGGKIDGSETPEQAALREASEEIQFTGEVKLTPLLTYRSPSLVFHNFMGLVPTQFTPLLNWESDGYVWTKLDKLPHPMHYGLTAILADTQSRRLLNLATS